MSIARTWPLALDREREWPAGQKVTEIVFRYPTLADRATLPEIERNRVWPDRSSTYEIVWPAVQAWLEHLVADKDLKGLVAQLDLAESERAKERLIGFFTPAAASKPSGAPPTISSSAPVSPASTRID